MTHQTRIFSLFALLLCAQLPAKTDWSHKKAEILNRASAYTKAAVLGLAEGAVYWPTLYGLCRTNREKRQLKKEEALKKPLSHYAAKVAYIMDKHDMKKYPELFKLYKNISWSGIQQSEKRRHETLAPSRWTRLFRRVKGFGPHTQHEIPKKISHNDEPFGTFTQKMFLGKAARTYARRKVKTWDAQKHTIENNTHALTQRLSEQQKNMLDKQIKDFGVQETLYQALTKCQTALERDCKPRAIHNAQKTVGLQKWARAGGSLGTTATALTIAGLVALYNSNIPAMAGAFLGQAVNAGGAWFNNIAAIAAAPGEQLQAMQQQLDGLGEMPGQLQAMQQQLNNVNNVLNGDGGIQEQLENMHNAIDQQQQQIQGLQVQHPPQDQGGPEEEA